MTLDSQADLVQEIFKLPDNEHNVTIINGVEHKVCFATKGVKTCGRRLPITEFHFRDTARHWWSCLWSYTKDADDQ